MLEFGYLFDCEVMNEPGMNEGIQKDQRGVRLYMLL